MNVYITKSAPYALFKNPQATSPCSHMGYRLAIIPNLIIEDKNGLFP